MRFVSSNVAEIYIKFVKFSNYTTLLSVIGKLQFQYWYFGKFGSKISPGRGLFSKEAPSIYEVSFA